MWRAIERCGLWTSACRRRTHGGANQLASHLRLVIVINDGVVLARFSCLAWVKRLLPSPQVGVFDMHSRGTAPRPSCGVVANQLLSWHFGHLPTVESHYFQRFSLHILTGARARQAEFAAGFVSVPLPTRQSSRQTSLQLLTTSASQPSLPPRKSKTATAYGIVCCQFAERKVGVAPPQFPSPFSVFSFEGQSP